MYSRFGKRCLDLAVAVPAILGLAPFFLVVGALVRLDSPGPALFVQPRLGRDGKVFSAFKFRTMTTTPRAVQRQVLPEDPDLTRIGRWLRRFKVDEFPQVLNVLRGDMSLVGPRPALPEQVHSYDERSRRRLAVRPGLTGLAQVNGNVYLTWPQRWHFDLLYVEHLSFRLDLQILARTLAVIRAGEERFVSQPLVPCTAACSHAT